MIIVAVVALASAPTPEIRSLVIAANIRDLVELLLDIYFMVVVFSFLDELTSNPAAVNYNA